MNELKNEACKIALIKLFKDNMFSICVIDNLLKLTNTIPDPEVYKILSVLHCVSYSEMSSDFRKELFKIVMTMFKDNGFDFDEIEKMYKSNIIEIKPMDNKSFLKKLLG